MQHVIDRGKRAPGAQRAARRATDEGSALVERPRLTDRLQAAIGGRLTVLTAPAGYGKSVVVRQWARTHVGAPLTWITFRATDDAPRVAARLAVGLGRIGVDLGSATSGAWVAATDPGLGGRFVDVALAALEPIGDAVVVLNGLDAPRNAGLVAELEYLVDHAPPNVHIVVTRRSPRPASRYRIRAVDGATVLDASDLTWTVDEVRDLVRRVAGRELTDGQLERLVARTGGWAVGLKVAAISLRRAPDADDVIDGLGGERHIEAFLRDEVLDHLSRHARRFLAHTSVLDELTAASCRAVTDEVGSGVTLRSLERRGVLRALVARDEDAFVLHPLLRDLVRRELRATEPEAETRLLTRAAAWHIDRGEPQLAGPYLVAAERWDDLVRLVDRHARTLFERGAAHEMARWLDAVPVTAPQRHEVALRRAYAYTMIGDATRAEHALRDLDGARTSSGEATAVNVLRATWAFLDASPQSVIEAADAALLALQSGDAVEEPILGMTSRRDVRMMAVGSRARAQWYVGDIASSRAALTTLVKQRGAYAPWRVRALGALGLLEAWAGDLCSAQRHASQAFDVAASANLVSHPATLDALLALAHTRRERGDVGRAGTLLDEARAISALTPQPVTLTLHTIERAAWCLAADEPERGLAEIRDHRANGRPVPPVIEHHLRAIEIRLLLASGQTDQAATIVRSAIDADGTLPRELASAAVQAAVARHDLAGARDRLDQWPAGGPDLRAQLERDLWRAVVDFESGRRHDALRRAADVVATAQPQGHLRLFLDAGQPATRLLRALLRGAPTPYLRHVLDATEWGSVAARRPAGLSAREQEVVRYLPTPLTNAEIAARLYVSVNTLKTHLRTIYRKLDVTDRRDAIERAERLGIA